MKQLSTTAKIEPVRGSLVQVSQASNKPLAKVMLGISAVILFDSSSSMGLSAGGSESRYELAHRELSRLQAEIPGKIAVVAFGETVAFCPDGNPPAPHGGTAMTEALEFCKLFDIKSTKFILISDGAPNNRDTALDVAKTYKNTIHTVYTGKSGSEYAEAFLREVSTVSGGRFMQAHQAVGLLPVMRSLLTVS